MTTTATRLRTWAGEPVPADSWARFERLFGVLAAVAAIRFVLMGWVRPFYVEPTFFFRWLPVPVPSESALYALFALQALAGVCIALGRATRVALSAWLVSFVYVELLDKSLYLNHYVLFTLLGAVLLCAPRPAGGTIPRWTLVLGRTLVASVYVWAGLCKLNADWLLRAEPLRTWLQARVDMPIVGPMLAEGATAHVMSWSGALYDLTVPFLILWPRTRRLGVAWVLAFHAAVGVVFPIGMFPWLMLAAATLLLDPGPARIGPQRTPTRPGTLVWLAAMVLITLWPARFLLYGPDVSWTERGYRFAWRVLLNEKTGLVHYRVDRSDEHWRVDPSEELTELQHKQMRTQPDMIWDYAQHLCRRYLGATVHVDSFASLNGRPSQRFIDPEVDLCTRQTVLYAQGWILPLHGDK